MTKGWKRESARHALARKGVKTGKKDKSKIGRKIRRITRPMIGDGKLPNKYWVSYHNDFLICDKGHCDWASEKIKFKSEGTTIKKPFNTFKEALEYIDRNVFINPEPKKEGVNTITIEDRLSGEVWEQFIYAYKRKDSLLKGYGFDTGTHEDTGFTKKEMEKRGVVFE